MNEAAIVTGLTEGGSRPEGPTLRAGYRPAQACPAQRELRGYRGGARACPALPGPCHLPQSWRRFASREAAAGELGRRGGQGHGPRQTGPGTCAPARHPRGFRWPPPHRRAEGGVPQVSLGVRPLSGLLPAAGLGARGGVCVCVRVCGVPLSPGAAAGGGRGRAERRRAGPAQRGASRRGGGARRGGGGAGRSRHGAASGAPACAHPAHGALHGGSEHHVPASARPAAAPPAAAAEAAPRQRWVRRGPAALPQRRGGRGVWQVRSSPRRSRGGGGGRRASCLPGHPGVYGRGHPLAVGTCGGSGALGGCDLRGPGTLFSGRMQPGRS